MGHQKILSPKEEIFKTLDGENIGYFPRVVLLNSPVVDMMESAHIYWPKAHCESLKMARLAVAIQKSTGFNAVNLPWDACVELEALGGESCVGSKPVDIPIPKKPAFNNPNSVRVPKDIFSKGRFPIVLKAVRLTREMLGSDVAIVPLVEGPMNLSCLCLGSDTMYRLIIKDVENAKHVLNIIADLCVEYGNQLLHCGGDVIQLSDPYVQGLTAKHFTSLIIPVYKKISSGIKGRVFLHICGNTRSLLNHLPESGFSAFSFDAPSVCATEVRNAIGDRMRLIGSVPTVSHILEGTEEDVFAISLQCIIDGVDILSPSCGLPPNASITNLKAMVRAIEYYNKEKFGF